MAVIVNRNEQNDELSRRISADLRTKAMETADMSGADEAGPDLAEDAEYLKDLRKTGKFGWIWIVLIVLAAISLITIVLI